MLIVSEKTYSFPFFNRKIEVRVGFGVYEDNKSLAVVLLCRTNDLDEDVMEEEENDYEDSSFNEILFVVTVNLESSAGLPFGEQYVDVNDYPQIAMWLIDNQLAFPSGQSAKNGRNIYPTYKFQVPPNYQERLERDNGE